MKKTVTTFAKAKQSGEKLTMLTAYDYSTAKLMDESGVDAILVGDSLGNVILGYDSTVAVTMEDMIHHGAAVARGAKEAMVVVDMPFMSYQTSVMAHLGLTPQSVNAFGGFKVQCKDELSAKKLVKDALAVQAAGAFAVVLECVPAKLAAYVTSILDIPTIGIGAGAECDGQVLVYQDMLGMFSDYTPKFVKKYADAGSFMRQAFADYINETKSGAFPSEEHGYKIDDEVMKKVMEEEK